MLDRKALEAALRPLKMKIANTVARAVVTLVDNAKKLQEIQAGVLDGEEIDEAEHFHAYGFCSVPLPGAEAVIVFPNGDRAHALITAIADRRYRPTDWLAGEVGLHTDEPGHTVRLRRDKITTLEAETIELGGIGVTEKAIKGDTFKVAYDAHIHPTPMGPSGLTVPLAAPALSTKVKVG